MTRDELYHLLAEQSNGDAFSEGWPIWINQGAWIQS